MPVIIRADKSVVISTWGEALVVPDGVVIVDLCAEQPGRPAAAPGIPRWVLRCDGREQGIGDLAGCNLATAADTLAALRVLPASHLFSDPPTADRPVVVVRVAGGRSTAS